MPSRRITYSPQQIREKLPVELGHLDELQRLQPNATFVSTWREFIVELQSLAVSDDVDTAKVERFIERIRDYIARERAKGIEPLIWMAEDLQRYAREQQVI